MGRYRLSWAYSPRQPTATDWSLPYNPSHAGTGMYFLLPYIEQDNLFKEPRSQRRTQRSEWPGWAASITTPATPVTSPNHGAQYPGGAMTLSRLIRRPLILPLPVQRHDLGRMGQRGATSYALNWHVFRGWLGRGLAGRRGSPDSVLDSGRPFQYHLRRRTLCHLRRPGQQHRFRPRNLVR